MAIALSQVPAKDFGILAGLAPQRPEIDIHALERHILVAQRRVRAGQRVYCGGQPFHMLYLVRAGFIKTCELSADGRERISGFRMQGDLIGAEAIGLTRYPCDAVALEDSTIWELPYPAMLDACRRLPELETCLTAALADEIRRDRVWMLNIGTLPADQRVAMFLLDLARRHAQLGFSSRHFILRMGRSDIASFLALTHETVSRALSHLEHLGHVLVHRRDVRLLDVVALSQFAGATTALN